MNRWAITFDIEWAPEWIIAACREACDRLGVTATFFATHDSAETRRLIAEPQWEVGIHPNFLAGSSHGADPHAVLDFGMTLVPAATVVRTHALVQSTRLFNLMADHYPQIRTDVSLLLPEHTHLRPFKQYFGASRRPIVRVPCYWEDDLHAGRPDCRWDTRFPEGPGLRVLNFHPVLLALNIFTIDAYYDLKRALGQRRMHEATPEDVQTFASDRFGDRDYFEQLVTDVGPENFRTISAIVDEWESEPNL